MFDTTSDYCLLWALSAAAAFFAILSKCAVLGPTIEILAVIRLVSWYLLQNIGKYGYLVYLRYYGY